MKTADKMLERQARKRAPPDRETATSTRPSLTVHGAATQKELRLHPTPDAMPNPQRLRTETVCPFCATALSVDPDQWRRKLRCPKCLNIIPPAPSAPQAPLPEEGRDVAPSLETRPETSRVEAPHPIPPSVAPDFQVTGKGSEAAGSGSPGSSQADDRIVALTKANGELSRQLDQARTALRETAEMVVRITEVEARLSAMASNYVQAVCRLSYLNRENARLRREKS